MRKAAVLALGLFVVVPQLQCRRIQQRQDALTEEAGGNTGLCPRWQPELGARGGDVPSLVVVTIRSASDIPWSYTRGDKPDPYVEFWMGGEGRRQSPFVYHLLPGHKPEKYWRAETPHRLDNADPSWEWSCLLAYDNQNATFSAVLWDRDDLRRDDYIGKAEGNLLEIMEYQDGHGHGVAEASFSLKKMGKPDEKNGIAKLEPTGAVLNVKFQIIHEPSLYLMNERPEAHFAHSTQKKLW